MNKSSNSNIQIPCTTSVKIIGHFFTKRSTNELANIPPNNLVSKMDTQLRMKVTHVFFLNISNFRL